MTDTPFPGAFRHQHQDPRGLVERIEAQLRERLEEAVEMAGLKLMVDLRSRHGRPAPATTSTADRKEFEAITADLLVDLRAAFHAELEAAEQAELSQAEAGHEAEHERLIAGQVYLARHLPDYWQRFERYRAAYSTRRLAEPIGKSGWLGRLLGG